MANYVTIQVKPDTKATIEKQAQKQDKKLVKYVGEMADYFDKTGLNPSDMVVLSPAEELKQFRSTIISFMRKQEKDFIIPVFSRIDSVAVKLTEYIENNASKSKEEKTTLKPKSSSIASKIQDDSKRFNQEISSEKDTIIEPDTSNDSAQYEQKFKQLNSDYEVLKQKYDTMFKYFNKVINSIENKSTGLAKAPVCSVSIGEINDYKKYLKRL